MPQNERAQPNPRTDQGMRGVDDGSDNQMMRGHDFDASPPILEFASSPCYLGELRDEDELSPADNPAKSGAGGQGEQP